MKTGGGGAAGRRRTKDQEMAHRLKVENVRRTTGRCPLCNCIVGNDAAYEAHIARHARGSIGEYFNTDS